MELSQLVENAYAAGRAAWPGVRLDKGAFADRVRTLELDPEALTARASDVSMRPRPRATTSSSTSRTTTSSPARAHTSAMPEPMSPQPTTPTRSMPMAKA